MRPVVVSPLVIAQWWQEMCVNLKCHHICIGRFKSVCFVFWAGTALDKILYACGRIAKQNVHPHQTHGVDLW
jgi:hypothetical protein